MIGVKCDFGVTNECQPKGGKYYVVVVLTAYLLNAEPFLCMGFRRAVGIRPLGVIFEPSFPLWDFPSVDVSEGRYSL